MKKSWLILSLNLILWTAAYANETLEVTGTLDIPIKMNLRGANNQEKEKHVHLLDLKLSTAAKRALQLRVDTLNQVKAKLAFAPEFKLAASRQLGMGSVPVLDQGRHGSCVTFAVTGALDAAMKRGDEISQLCSLSLGRYLAEHGAQCCSGWNGSYGATVLDQIKQYGYMTMPQQLLVGCSGVRLYPLYDSDEGNSMSPDLFAYYRQWLPSQVYWQQIVDSTESLQPGYNSEAILEGVKRGIANGERSVFGVLVDTNIDSYGLVGYRSSHDAWVVSDSIKDDLRHGRVHSGHEMIITGYDDNATIRGQRGVLTLRNSWGRYAGDGGTYYMSYDYFKLMTHDAHVIHGL